MQQWKTRAKAEQGEAEARERKRAGAEHLKAEHETRGRQSVSLVMSLEAAAAAAAAGVGSSLSSSLRTQTEDMKKHSKAAAAMLKQEQGQREALEARLWKAEHELKKQERMVAELLEAQDSQQQQDQRQRKSLEARLRQVEQQAEAAEEVERLQACLEETMQCLEEAQALGVEREQELSQRAGAAEVRAGQADEQCIRQSVAAAARVQAAERDRDAARQAQRQATGAQQAAERAQQVAERERDSARQAHQRAEAGHQQLQRLRGSREALAACDLVALGSLQRAAQEGLAAIQAALQERLEANVRAAPSLWSTLTVEGVADEAAVRGFFARRQQRATGGQRLRIASMFKVENQHTLGRFSTANSFHISPLDAHRGRGDTLLFHGCPKDVALDIQTKGLVTPGTDGVGVRHGSMLGRGIYGAPDPRKSIHYSTSEEKYMFICRFNLSSARHAGPSTSHRNSVYDEFCVDNERHVVVLWMLKLEHE